MLYEPNRYGLATDTHIGARGNLHFELAQLFLPCYLDWVLIWVT